MASDIKWIKIVTDIFDDEKILMIESMPEADTIIVVWFKLLCLAGKTNRCGILTLNDRIAYTDEMLSYVFRRPINTVRLALKTFEQLGMIEVINDTIVIPNWEKHQNVDKMMERREYNRLAKQRSRERQRLALENKLLVSGDVNDNVSTNVNDISLTSQPSSISISRSQSHSSSSFSGNGERGTGGEENGPSKFDIFWEAYGYKKGKKNAQKAFAKIDPDDALFQKILEGIEAYHKSRNWREGYRKEPTTWLNGECWEDDYSNDKDPAKGNQKTVSAQNYEQRNYTEEELLSVGNDLLEEAKRSRKGGE